MEKPNSIKPSELISLDEALKRLRASFRDEDIYRYKNQDEEELLALRGNAFIGRFNEVFGVNGWGFVHDIVQEPKVKFFSGVDVPYYSPAVVKGKIWFHAKESDSRDITVETPIQYGGNASLDHGDAYKGAVTDCMIKCGQWLGMAKNIFDGDYKIMKTSKSAEAKILKKIRGN